MPFGTAPRRRVAPACTGPGSLAGAAVPGQSPSRAASAPQPSWRGRRAGPGAPPTSPPRTLTPSSRPCSTSASSSAPAACRPMARPAPLTRSLGARPQPPARLAAESSGQGGPLQPPPPFPRPPRPRGEAPPPGLPAPGTRPRPLDRPGAEGCALLGPLRSQLSLCLGPQPPPGGPRPNPAPAKPGLESGMGLGPGPCALDHPPSTCTPLPHLPTDPRTPKSICSHTLSHSADVTPRGPLSRTLQNSTRSHGRVWYTHAHYNFGSQDYQHTVHTLTCLSTARERLHTLTPFTQLSYSNSPPRLKRSLYPLKTFTSTGDTVDTGYTHTHSAAHVHSHIFTHIYESQDRKRKDVFILRFPTGSHSSHTGQHNFFFISYFFSCGITYLLSIINLCFQKTFIEKYCISVIYSLPKEFIVY